MMEIVPAHEFFSTGAASQPASQSPNQLVSQPVGQPALHYRYSIIAETPLGDVCFAYLPSCNTSGNFRSAISPIFLAILIDRRSNDSIIRLASPPPSCHRHNGYSGPRRYIVLGIIATSVIHRSNNSRRILYFTSRGSRII